MRQARSTEERRRWSRLPLAIPVFVRSYDEKGKEYLDANSSIWTNLHGHNHPKINLAIQRQLKKIAHSSALPVVNAIV